ncbi:hypothetical protein MIND_01411000 [Mycena indigotica]|uniref:Uncharacterized protein n=1 Tax=Mycena indigotica TaxID=2126181 RepID=A0A8H6VR51_9AGAR|nr:uncharacterized protein MIND_01411000 [Mycena indigotica]KAF7288946.1 hypothetical protein MIND_01411000 [Mycena indigotica]
MAEGVESPYPHPFHADDMMGEGDPGMCSPRTALELRMCALSSHIRQKSRWWEKFCDEAIREKWVVEAKEQQTDLKSWEKLSDNMLNFVMEELGTYHELRDMETGIECGPYDGIYLSDTLISEQLRQELIAAVKPLEQVPPERQDWHPGSDERVLDLVHPSLYPLIFNQSWGLDENDNPMTFPPPSAEELGVDEQFVSQRFQWLSSNFKVAADGNVTLTSPYINNIAPNDALALVPAIEKVMSKAVSLWEHVLAAMRGGQTPERVRRTTDKRYLYDTDDIDCIWPDEPEYPPDGEDEDDWLTSNGGRLVLPDAPMVYDRVLPDYEPVSLRESRLQVIVKLANIMLTPEKPEYGGGIWHVEGMATESIVSTFIYYYEADNIEPCDLRFRMGTSAPGYHGQDDYFCSSVLYGFTRNESCVQDIGSVTTIPHRSIAFPNLYQHQVSPFKLVDPSKPGVRKILVFFLVDPTKEVVSTSDVPPQQLPVLREALLSIAREPTSRLAMLPVELIDLIAKMVPGVMTLAEAKRVREELMQERSLMIADVNKEYFAREFNMWYVLASISGGWVLKHPGRFRPTFWSCSLSRYAVGCNTSGKSLNARFKPGISLTPADTKRVT